MGRSKLVGTELPSGKYEVEGWKAHLWADATRNNEDAFRYTNDAQSPVGTSQLVPHSMCQHIVFEATGGIKQTMSRLTEDWASGAALGGLRADFHAPIEVGETLYVEGVIESVVEKEGSSGELTIVTHTYSVETTDGTAVYDLEVDMVILEDA
ncbi:FAS1-like dehydratase domain-containing protein [Halococcus sediminicola]|uniref:FAS1-like dehydratase domain-containing protein n=1 Tax=Halococcus sediminicola TaxID=1264579 RepID=UPI000678B713|nr:MaoC family dehydratase N-terminal domain-containing protein [Halococcus sediminicola]